MGFLAGHATWTLVLLLLRDGLKEIRDKTLQGRMIRLATHTRLYISDISSRRSVALSKPTAVPLIIDAPSITPDLHNMMNLKTATGDSKSIQSGLRPTVEGENIGTKTSGLTELWHRVSSILGVELQGSDPAPVEHKTDRRYLKLFTLWFSMNFNLIS